MNILALSLFSLLLPLSAYSKTVDYRLEIDRGLITAGDHQAEKFTVNGSIPGPVLKFTVGDMARITVVNRLDHETLIHWHGILLPNDQDGVPYINSMPIPAHGSKVYEFPITHAGTYWYHSHVMFQEQDGVYGAINIFNDPEPRNQREATILFSDFSVESGQQIHKNLKKEGEYYAIKKNFVQSWWAAIRTGNVFVKLRNSLQRMGGMDYADIAYDAFLANGRVDAETLSDVTNGMVKLRLINGSGSSIYKVTYGNGPMTILEADGNPVEPIRVDILPLSVAETYDILVEVPKGKKVELRATSIDNSGFASAWIGQGSEKLMAKAPPWINPISLTMSESMGMPQMSFFSELAMNYSNEAKDLPRDMSSSLGPYSKPDLGMGHKMKEPKSLEKPSSMDHSHHKMSHHHEMKVSPMNMGVGSTTPQRIMTLAPESETSNLINREKNHYNELTYGLLRAKSPIQVAKSQQLRTFHFTLNGNMENYVWTINGRPLGPETYIKIKKGERVRFVMKNTTMMNHPMHLHGHFFRVMTDQGEWSVLKHTVNVASMGKTIIEFDANEKEDWFFHCHVLFHMMDGMTRIVRYEDQPGSEEMLAERKKSKEFNMRNDFFLSSKILGQSNSSRLEGKYFSALYMFEYDVIGNYEGDFEGEIHASRTLTRYLGLYLGAKSEAEEDRFKHSPTLGFTWILPLNLNVDVKYQPNLDKKIEAEFANEIQLTDKLQLNLEYSSVRKFYTELEYRQTKNLSFVANYNETYSNFGAGLGYTY
ncbi:multicopper oxidase domain-containing protein [bacterium]|nr:multicopper oxidase domain-containing protein [bacterium]